MKRIAIFFTTMVLLTMTCTSCSEDSLPSSPQEAIPVWTKPTTSTSYQYPAGWTPSPDPEQTEEEEFFLQQVIPMVDTKPGDFNEYMVFDDIDDFCETVFRNVRISEHEISQTSDGKILLNFFPRYGESQFFEFDKIPSGIVLSRVVLSSDEKNYELTVDQQVRLMMITEIGNRLADAG